MAMPTSPRGPFARKLASSFASRRMMQRSGSRELPSDAVSNQVTTIDRAGTIFTARAILRAAFALGLLLVFAQNASSQNGPLSFGDNSFVTGDYIVAGSHGMTTTFSGGYAVGTFIIPDTNPGIHGRTSVPLGAEVVAAILYWQTVENVGTVPGQPGTGENGFFRPLIANGPSAPGYPITGVSLPGHNAVAWSQGGCSQPATGKITRTYRANVLSAFPQDGKGNVLTNGQFEVRLPSVGPQTPLTIGATLVIIYRVLSPNVPLSSIVIYDGAFGQADGSLNMTQTVQGFYDAGTDPVSPLPMISKLTLIAGHGLSNKSQTVYLNSTPLSSHAGHNLPPFPGYYGSWDNPTWTFGDPAYPEIANPIGAGAVSATAEVVPSANNPGCLSWGAVIVSTTVDEPDGDGLLRSWKTAGGYCDVSVNGGVCTPGSNTDPGWVALPGATLGEKDLFIQLDYMCSQTTGIDSCTTGDGTNYSFDPRPSGAVGDWTVVPRPVDPMTQAFLNHGIHVHINPPGTIQPVHAIQEQTCTDALPALCPFPDQAGVVGWKGGYANLKNQHVETSGANAGNVANCLAANPPNDCQPRFQNGRKDSWHYALFAHAIGRSEWKFWDSTLTSVVQSSSNIVTFTTSTPLNTLIDPTSGGYDNHSNILHDPNCGNGRVSIYYAATNTNLNGTFCINSFPGGPGGDTFTIAVPGTPNAKYTRFTDPWLAVVPGQTPSYSGASDVGGADSLITLGLWGDPTLDGLGTTALQPISNGQQENTIVGTFMHETGHSLGLTHGGIYFDQPAPNYTLTIEPNCKPNFQSVMNYFFQVDWPMNGPLPDYSEQQLDELHEAPLDAGVTFGGLAPLFANTKWYTTVQPMDVGSTATLHCNGTPPSAAAGELPTYLDQGPAVATMTSQQWATGGAQDVDFDGPPSNQSLRGYDDWNSTAITTGIDLRQISATGTGSVFPKDNFLGGGQPAGGGGQPAGGGGQPAGGGGQPAGGGGQPAGGGGEFSATDADSYTHPTIVTGSSEGASPRTITLIWIEPYGQIVAFNVYRSTAGGPFTVINAANTAPPHTVTGTPPVTKFTDTVTCNPAGYRYFVTAVAMVKNKLGQEVQQESVASNTAPATGQPAFTGCYALTGGSNALSVTGFASPAANNGNATFTQGATIPISIPVTDDFYPTGGTVPVTANKALVAIGPFPYDGNCPAIGTVPVYLNYPGTYPQPYTILPAGTAGFTNTNNLFMTSWNTSTANAGCYVLEADFDSGQVDRTEIQLTIYESDSSPHILNTTLPTATAGIPINANTIQEAGGVSPFTWSISVGALPPGLSIDSTGTISGTPTTAGNYNFTVKIVDANKNFGTQAFTMKVLIFVSYSTPPTINPTLPTATAGISLNDTIQQYGAVGAVTWSITSGALPPGSLTLTTGNAGNGTLAGTPSTAGTYNFTAQATDSKGNTGSLAFTVTVNIFVSYSAPPTLSGTLPTATAGIAYTPNPIQQYGAVGAVTWSITSGALPPGSLTLTTGNAGNGTLAGTPSTAGTYNFTAQATDSKGNTGSLAFTMTVNIFVSDTTAPTITTTLPQGVVGTFYSNTLDESGGAAGTLTWNITAGAPPPGITLNSGNGFLSGTPTTPGTYNFTVQVTDSLGNTSGMIPFTLTISACITTPPGLVSWYPFNGNPLDTVGGKPGTVVGSGSQFLPAEVGQGFKPGPQASGGIVVVPDSPTLALSQFTIGAWVRVDNIDNVETMPIVWKGNNTLADVTSPYTLGIVGALSAGPGRVIVIITNGVSGQEQVVFSNAILTTGTFHYIAVTADGANVNLYVDGQLDTSTSQVYQTFVSTNPLQIGGVQGANTDAFDGVIDELQIWNRALMPAEVSGIFNASTAGECQNIWFTENGGVSHIGKITLFGSNTITEYLAAFSSPAGITAGPTAAAPSFSTGGNVWFTDSNNNAVGAINSSGANTAVQVATMTSSPFSVTAGPDGNLWFTESCNSNTTCDPTSNSIGRITPSGTFKDFQTTTASSNPVGITAGPDGNLWFTESSSGANSIGRITPSGSITEFLVSTPSSVPQGITAGPDGNVWFTESNGNNIGVITPTGTIIEYLVTTVGSHPYGIATGPDGNLWFTESTGNKIGVVTPKGAIIAEYTIPTASSSPRGITAGSDGNMWFTEYSGNQIGRITPAGVITEFAIPTLGSAPFGITQGQ